MADQQNTPPIIIKKVIAHGGHHGGAWKVAYADFVTAMMALFIVLWLLNSSEKVQKAVGGYFRDPEGYGKQVGSGQAGLGESLAVTKNDLNQLKEKIDRAVKESPQLKAFKDQVQTTVTGEGLRIELLETERGMFFESGSPIPTDRGREVLGRLAEELGKLPNPVLVEGHTDSRQFSSEKGYSNWELSADRANSTRRFMQDKGLRDHQVVQVRGYADQRLWKPKEPDNPANRRVSIIVQYQDAKPSSAEPEKSAAKEGAADAGEKKPSPQHQGDAPKKPESHNDAKPSPVPEHH